MSALDERAGVVARVRAKQKRGREGVGGGRTTYKQHTNRNKPKNEEILSLIHADTQTRTNM